MSPPSPPPHKDAQEVCVWCRVLELISPLYGMYIDKTVKCYTTSSYAHCRVALVNWIAY